MEKNGNTYAPGDPVSVRLPGQKLASTKQGTVETIDPDTGRAHVKLAGGETVMVDIAALERA